MAKVRFKMPLGPPWSPFCGCGCGCGCGCCCGCRARYGGARQQERGSRSAQARGLGRASPHVKCRRSELSILLKPPLPRHAERARPRLANWSGSCGVRTATQGQRCSRPLRGRRTSEPPQPSSTNGSEPSSSGGARSGQCPSSLGTAFGVRTPNARKAKRLLWSAAPTPNSVAPDATRQGA